MKYLTYQTLEAGLIVVISTSIIMSAFIKFLNNLYPRLTKIYLKNPYSVSAKIISFFFIIKDPAIDTFELKINESLKKLKSVSSEVRNVIDEVESIAREKQSAIEGLAQKERELKVIINGLENSKAVDLIELVLKKNDKQSAKRDYILVGITLIVSSVITILIEMLLKK